MTATLTVNEDGGITLPESIIRVLGLKPGNSLRAEVSRDRLEIVKDGADDVPEVTEVTADGVLVLPAGVMVSAVQIVNAIKAGREERMRKLSRS